MEKEKIDSLQTKKKLLFFVGVGLFLLIINKKKQAEESTGSRLEENLRSYVEHNYRPFRKYLEKGDFSNVDEESKEQYRKMSDEIDKIRTQNERDDYAKNKLYSLALGDTYKLKTEAKEILEGNAAKQALEHGQIFTRQRELEGLARECGYIVVNEGRSEGVSILDPETGKLLTIIPRHDANRNTAKTIMNVLASGKSNFRRTG